MEKLCQTSNVFLNYLHMEGCFLLGIVTYTVPVKKKIVRDNLRWLAMPLHGLHGRFNILWFLSDPSMIRKALWWAFARLLDAFWWLSEGFQKEVPSEDFMINVEQVFVVCI